MKWYIARRVAWAVVVAYLITSVTFGLITAAPRADIATAQFQAAQGGANATEVEAALRRAQGLDEPLWQRYTDYMTGMATLNWGWSETRSQPVLAVTADGLLGVTVGCLTGQPCSQVTGVLGSAIGSLTDLDPVGAYHALLPTVYGAIPDAMPYSLMYAVPATAISVVVGLSIGLYSAVNQYTVEDYVATFVAFFGISIPNFWFGIVLILVVAVQLDWIDVLYDPDAPLFSAQNLKQNVLPVVVLATAGTASHMRYGRAEALEYVNAEFVKTARAKGANGMRILTRHILRPALVPLSTILVGDLLGLLVAGAYLTEVVFGIPGLGRLAIDAIRNQDTALVIGTTLIPVFIGVIGNLLQDLAYTVLDPRIDFGDR
jgi:peptide/nickel transport system permease protein